MNIRSAFSALLAFTYPPHCEVCAIPLARPHALLCPWCELPPLSRTVACGRCDEPGAPLCRACALQPLLSGRVLTAGEYAGASESAIKAFKYRSRRRVGRLLADRMLARIMPDREDWNLIVPVPSSGASLASRGFHHTLQLAMLLGIAIKVPVARWALWYRNSPAPQASLPPEARWENIRGTLHARLRDGSGKRVLLVDDVLTTGATIAEAERALRAVGAGPIDAITAVRSRHCMNYRLERMRAGERQLESRSVA